MNYRRKVVEVGVNGGMRNVLGTVVLAVVTLVATALGVIAPGAVAHAESPVRIMLAGDSITQGFDGDFTWRYRIFEEFTRLHVPVDFVGPRNEPYGGANAYLVAGWDSDHDAKGGTTLAAQLDSITADMSGYLPDVLVALYGTNDLRAGATPAQLMDRWRAYVERARAVRPDVTLVLGEVYSRHASARGEANAALNALAAELSTEESRVLVADLDSPEMVLARDSYDGTHPTPTGETLIAQRVAEALQARGILPAAPQIAQPFVAWTPPVRAVVHRVGRTLSLDWFDSLHRYRAREMRVRWTNLRTGHTVTTRWMRRTTHLRTGRLSRGRYRVQLDASRRTMTAVWGPATYRRVP
jgi:lysophospholipase L1-like esterase